MPPEGGFSVEHPKDGGLAAGDCGLKLADVLGVMGAELNELACASDRVQEIVGSILSEMTMDDKTASTDIQVADRLTQYLYALSVFTINLSRLVPSTWLTDGARATADMPLAELANRLSLGHAQMIRQDAGELDLF